MEREYYYPQIACLAAQCFADSLNWLLPEAKVAAILQECLDMEATFFSVCGTDLAAFLGYYACGRGFFNLGSDCLRRHLSAQELVCAQKRLANWQSKCSSDTMYIEALATAAGHRRQGLAANLLSVAENTAKEWGLKRLALEVADNNYGAMALYLKCGFVCTDSRPTPCDFWDYANRLWLEKRI